MAFCVQCGESFSVDVQLCPSCKRPVGLSSIGTALERRPPKGRIRLLKVAAVAAALSVVAVVVARYWPSGSAPTAAQMQRAAELAKPSLVKLSGPDGREVGGVVFRRLGKRLVVLAPATVAPAGRAVEVSGPGGSAKGFSLLSGGAPEIDQLAVVFVPDAGALAVTEARLDTNPALDRPIVALTSAGQAASAGSVLSFEDGDESGSLVHDVDLNVAEPGFGFWALDGRLFALATFAPSRGESLALAVKALSARLLIHELPVLADGSYSEHSLPLSTDTRLGVAVEAKRLDVRVGKSAARRGRTAMDGWQTFDASVTVQGPLQVASEKAKGAAFAITLAPF